MSKKTGARAPIVSNSSSGPARSFRCEVLTRRSGSAKSARRASFVRRLEYKRSFLKLWPVRKSGVSCPMRRKTDKKRGAMGTFYVRCKIENHVDRSKSVVVPKLLVDTGSDYTWIPLRFLEK